MCYFAESNRLSPRAHCARATKEKNYGKAVGKTRLEKGKEGSEGGRMESTYDSAKWYTWYIW
jgi:hypothetical protein